MGKKVDGTLLIIGGAEDKDGDCEILSRFIKMSRNTKGPLVVVTTATQEPQSVGEEYYHIFNKLGAASIEVLDLDTRTKANQKHTAELLEKAGAIFFTGGDQLRITATLGGTLANEALKEAYISGVVIAGTSAGASVMSSTMIVEGDSSEAPKLNTIKMAPGLGMVGEVVIDQHFAQRGRIGRLLSAVAHNPYILGIGIDEDTAILVHSDAKLEIIGSHTVTFIDGRSVNFTNVSEHTPGQALAMENVNLHVLPKGFGFDLSARTSYRIESKEGEKHEDN